MNISAEDVYRVVRELGPVVPNKIKQRLGLGDATLVNVYLSDLKGEGKVRYTHLQLGSSRFYYTPEQVEKLAPLAEHLGEKDKRTANQLREQGVIRSSVVEPLVRVSLQNIPDFAKPIQVKTGSGEETFYRWFLLSSDQAQQKIKQMMGVREEPKETPKQEPAVTTQPEEKKAEPQEPAKTDTKPTASEKVEEKPPKKAPEKKPKEDQKTLAEPEIQSEFGEQILAYFEEKHIVIREFEEVRKGSEIDAVVELPTAVGRIVYFCKAKNKKKSNDGDLAAAILTAKSKMLPALYVTTGSVTKKALENKELQEIQVVELGS